MEPPPIWIRRLGRGSWPAMGGAAAVAVRAAVPVGRE
jgi:hypothetical protein